MSLWRGSPQKTTGSMLANAANTRLSGRRLMLVWIIWILLVAFAFVLLVASLPQYPAFFAHLQQPCIGKACDGVNGQLSSDALQMLGRYGVSSLMYAIFTYLTFSFIPAVVWILVGVILIWRKSDDWMALLVSLLLMLWGANFAIVFGTIAPVTPAWKPLYALLSIFSEGLIGPVFCLFPNGRFAPRWLVWIALAWVVATPLFIVPDLLPSIGWIISGPVFILLLVIMLGSQMYRYVRVSTLLQRQQTKWLLFGLSITVFVSDLGFPLSSLIFPQLAKPGLLANSILGGSLWAMLFLCIPVSIGIAMLRYRLWDIDILINRTLVYGSLTGILAIVYALSIIVFQSFLSGLAGGSDLAIVGSTLAIAALFLPLRYQIQRVIDRRFYRVKYDATRTLEAFSATLRNEVDLQQLREHLVGVVQETMQPTHVSLWVRSPEQARKQPSAWINTSTASSREK